MPSSPPFSLTGTRDDMTTFWGRCMFYYRAVDPRKCFETSDSVKRCESLLAEFQNMVPPAGGANDGGKAPMLPHGVSNEEMWRARDVVESCVHPTTRAVIPPPFRMAAFIPTNLFIVPFMMMPSTVRSPQRTIFIHWFNQTYNCAINYANRSSDEQPLTALLPGYAAAVSVSISGALGATVLVRRMGTTPSLASTLVRATVPMFALAFASTANLALMRWNEWASDGVEVCDEDGVPRGKSKLAGRDSLNKCAATRILWNVPCIFLPPLVATPLSRMALFRGRPVLTETLLCVFGLGVGVAPALAFYPSRVTVDATQLEPQFHHLTRLSNGEAVRSLNYYKGL